MAKAKKESKGLKDSLNLSANLMTGFAAAMHLGGAAIGAMRESMEKYLRSAEGGDALWAQLENRIFSLQGAFAAAVLGTDDAEEGFKQLDNSLGMLTGVVQGAISMFSLQEGALESMTKKGLLFAIDGVSLFTRAFASLGQIMRLGRVAFAAIEYGVTTFGLSLNYIGRVATSVFINGISAMIRSMRDLSAVAEAAAINTGNQALADSMTRFGDTLVRAQVRVDAYARSLSGTDSTDLVGRHDRALANYNETLTDTGEAMLSAEGRAEELNRQLAALRASVEDGSIITDPPSRPAERSGSNRAETESTSVLTGAINLLNAARERGIELVGQAIALEAPQLATQQAEIDHIRALEEAQRQKTQAAIQMMKEEQAASQAADEADAQAKRDKLKANISAQEGFASSSADAIAAIIEGEDGAAKAFQRMVGQKLFSEGTSAVYRGAISVAFGNPGGPAGIAAGIAAIAAGRAIMAGTAPQARGAVASGSAPPANAGTNNNNTVTNRTEVINNFGMLQDERTVSRAVVDALSNGKRFGMTNGLI